MFGELLMVGKKFGEWIDVAMRVIISRSNLNGVSYRIMEDLICQTPPPPPNTPTVIVICYAHSWMKPMMMMR